MLLFIFFVLLVKHIFKSIGDIPDITRVIISDPVYNDLIKKMAYGHPFFVFF